LKDGGSYLFRVKGKWERHAKKEGIVLTGMTGSENGVDK
jgi:hypothetical protein